MSNRYVVECVWSGYRSSQSRPCHRRVVKKWQAELLEKISGVQFTDGTSMSVSVRPCTFREKVQEIGGYDSLLHDILYYKFTGWVTVQSVIDEENRRKAEREAQKAVSA